jgi:enoyl-CoA hydratase/3-hydroxyacyl-CoA dehydrogenase
MATVTTFADSSVRYDVADGVATIVVDRPDVLNSLGPEVIPSLHDAFRQAIADDRVRGIVLGGQGKAFIVGVDIDHYLRCVESRELWRIVRFTEAVHGLLDTIDRSPKRVVARLGGAALGGGFEFALACDYLVASPAASFGFPETGLGIYPGFGGTQRASRIVGTALTKWLMFTGKTLSAAEALALGVVHQVVPNDQLESTCRAIAQGGPCPNRDQQRTPELAAMERFFATHRVDDLHAGTADCGGDAALARAMKAVAPKSLVALRLVERLIDQGSRTSLEEGLRLEVDCVIEGFSTEDAYRGLTFRAKRGLGQPVFAGR